MSNELAKINKNFEKLFKQWKDKIMEQGIDKIKGFLYMFYMFGWRDCGNNEAEMIEA